MIEKYIKNELSLKRYRKFKKDKSAVISLWILLSLFFFSLTAEFWANNRPHILSYQGRLYVPLFFDYHPSEFGRSDIFVMDYRQLNLSDKDWSIWPLIQWNPYESNAYVETYPSPPSKYNLFGTDDRGRDVFTRLFYGFRYTFLFAFGSWVITYTLGTLLGSIMGYVGGKADLIGQRLVEVIESVPVLFILITIISIFSPNLFVLICLTALFGWTGISLQMRGQFLSLRKREYVEAAQAIGANHSRIIFKHILPNGLTPLVTFSPFYIAAGVQTLSTLDYLGLGLPAPTPSWGELLDQAQKWFTTAEWLVWAPSGALLLTLTILNNIGSGIRDAYDSRT